MPVQCDAASLLNRLDIPDVDASTTASDGEALAVRAAGEAPDDLVVGGQRLQQAPETSVQRTTAAGLWLRQTSLEIPFKLLRRARFQRQRRPYPWSRIWGHTNEGGTTMISNMVLMAVMIGQTAADGPRVSPVLSEWAKRAQALALAELRANEDSIKAKVAAYHEQENERLAVKNQRLMDRIETVNIATDRIWAVTAGTLGQASYQYREPWAGQSFCSVPPTRSLNLSEQKNKPSPEELRNANYLLEGHLRDSRDLNRQAVQLYNAERSYWAVRAYWNQFATYTTSRSIYSTEDKHYKDKHYKGDGP
jgi:hypothetical protein